jgi:hypothetical protein
MIFVKFYIFFYHYTNIFVFLIIKIKIVKYASYISNNQSYNQMNYFYD